MDISLVTVRRSPFRAAGLAVAGGVILLGIYSIIRFAGDSDAATLSRQRVFVCGETDEPFDYELRRGDTIPVLSPHSDKFTGYPAELCFWTTDGAPKDRPTAVLLNVTRGIDGPTFCPDCGRLVVGFNPRPAPGVSPPPTREQLGRFLDRTNE